MYELVTPRLLLRQWRPEDEPVIAAMNRDPDVTRLLNRPLDEEAVAGFYGVVTRHWDQRGFGCWVVQTRVPGNQREVIGFAGLMSVPRYLAEAGPGPELGWRLARMAWGRGFATEAATAARDDALHRLGLTELISIIHPDNERSQRVAAKLGMKLDRTVDNPALGRPVEVWHLATSDGADA